MSEDPVRIQVDVRIRVPRGKKAGKRAVREAIERWAYTGTESRFVQVRAVHWINEERNNARLAVWKVATAPDVDASEYARLMIPGERRTGDTIEQARGSLRLSQMPTGAFASMVAVREVREAREVSARASKKNAPKRKGKVSKVRSAKRKGKKK